MQKQRVLLGELLIDTEAPIELRAELPRAEVVKRVAEMKDRLAFLLDTRFRPADPERPKNPGLVVEEVAGLLNCRCVTVLRMIRRGQLHPLAGTDGDEPYFDPAEVESVRRIPLIGKAFRLLPPR